MTQSPIPIGQTVQITGACLICNQFEISHIDSQKYQFENACPKCQQEAEDFLTNFGTHPDFVLADALTRTRELFNKAKLPLICGLVDQPSDVQIAAIDLAQRTDAVIDWTCNGVPLSILNAKQETGDITCTYGEIKERCDLMVLWGHDLVAKHPMFIDRFAADTPRLSVDWDREAQLDALDFLRNRKSASPSYPDQASLRAALDAAQYPVILVDDDTIEGLEDDGTLSLFQYIRSQNDTNHCRLVHLSRSENGHGIQSALTARAGAPFGITYRAGKPVFRGREFTAPRLLKKKAIDLLILVGSPKGLPNGSIPQSMNVIWLNDSFSEQQTADVMIPISKWGFDKTGFGVRNDGMPVQREAFLDTNTLDAAVVLRTLGQ